MSLIRFLLLLVVTQLIVSCSYIGMPSFIKNRDRQYLNAKSIPPVKIPPGTSTQQIHNEYPLPDRHYPQNIQEISQVPPGL